MMNIIAYIVSSNSATNNVVIRISGTPSMIFTQLLTGLRN